MPLEGLNHYTIRPVDLERTKEFYEDVLGLHVGYRPPLNFPGYWLYVGDNPTVHLIGPRADDAHPQHREAGPTGLLDHIAFSCTGLAEMKAAARQARHQARGAGAAARPADAALHPRPRRRGGGAELPAGGNAGRARLTPPHGLVVRSTSV